MFRYEHLNSTRKFTIVAEIVSLLKKMYKRDGPLRAVFKVKTLPVLFLPYPREMKTNTVKFKSAAILALACFYGNGAIHSHARSIARAWLKHAHSFDRCGFQCSVSWCWPKGSWALGTRLAGYWPSSFFYVFIDNDGIEVDKDAKTERGQCPAILTD